MPNLPIVPKIPAKPSLGNFGSRPRTGITSISHQIQGSTFHQFGDSVNRSAGTNRSDKIFGSINSAIKNKPASSLKPLGNNTNPTNQNFKPLIK